MSPRMDAEPNDDTEDREPATADTPTDAESTSEDTDSDEFAHLDSLSDGAGCTEIWEHLSESRDE
jgi:hypothetical protein